MPTEKEIIAEGWNVLNNTKQEIQDAKQSIKVLALFKVDNVIWGYDVAFKKIPNNNGYEWKYVGYNASTSPN